MNSRLSKLLINFSKCVEKGDTDGIVRMLKEHSCLRQKSINDCSALHYVRDDFNMLRLALSLGVNPDLRDSIGNTLLMDFSSLGYLKCIDLLLEFGADVNAINNSGESSLSIAVTRGNLDVAKKLLTLGANINIAVGGVDLSAWAAISGSASMQAWIKKIRG